MYIHTYHWIYVDGKPTEETFQSFFPIQWSNITLGQTSALSIQRKKSILVKSIDFVIDFLRDFKM